MPLNMNTIGMGNSSGNNGNSNMTANNIIDDQYYFEDYNVSDKLITTMKSDIDNNIMKNTPPIHGYVKDNNIRYISNSSFYNYDTSTDLKTKIPITGFKNSAYNSLIIFSNKDKVFYELYKNNGKISLYLIDVENMTCTLCASNIELSTNGLVNNVGDYGYGYLYKLYFIDNSFIFFYNSVNNGDIYKLSLSGVCTKLTSLTPSLIGYNDLQLNPSNTENGSIFYGIVNLWFDENGIFYILLYHQEDEMVDTGYSQPYTEFSLYKQNSDSMKHIKTIKIYVERMKSLNRSTADFVTFSPDRHHILLWSYGYDGIEDRYPGDDLDYPILYSINISDDNTNFYVRAVPYDSKNFVIKGMKEYTKSNTTSTPLKREYVSTKGYSWIEHNEASHIYPTYDDYYSEGSFYYFLSNPFPEYDDYKNTFEDAYIYENRYPVMRKFEYKRR